LVLEYLIGGEASARLKTSNSTTIQIPHLDNDDREHVATTAASLFIRETIDESPCSVGHRREETSALCKTEP